MNAEKYLENILARYAGTFDIQRPYRIGDKEYAAYGYFYSHTEKYVLVREANLWSSNCFEHILFYETDKLTEEQLTEADRLIRDYIEPQLVRRGEPFPDRNHMYSYMTIVFVSSQIPEKSVIKKLRKYSFDKGYRFHLRGFSQARLIAVSLPDEKIYTNYAAAKSKTPYRQNFQSN